MSTTHPVPLPPPFAVQGLRQTLAVRAPGVVWKGGDLPAVFAAARPRGQLQTLSAARPLGALVEALRTHARAWIAWMDVDGAERLRRVRWAQAEVGRRTRVVLVEPTLACPGWWPLHARTVDEREARERMARAGAESPEELAALNQFEPEALSLSEELLLHGLEAPAEVGIRFLAAPEGPADSSLRETAHLHGRRILRGEADPPYFRVFRPRALRRYLFEELGGITRALESGDEVAPEDLASWTAWARVLPIAGKVERLVATLAERNLELAVELRLARREGRSWDPLASWALELGDSEAAMHWARRARNSPL